MGRGWTDIIQYDAQSLVSKIDITGLIFCIMIIFYYCLGHVFFSTVSILKIMDQMFL